MAKKARVANPLNKWLRLDRRNTYCYNCGKGVHNQKYCKDCGAKLEWNKRVPKKTDNGWEYR